MLSRQIIFKTLQPLQRGSLELILPNGERRVFGGLNKDFQARIEVKDENFFHRCVFFGPIGFGESYMAGEWDTPDLAKVIAWFILNAEDTGGMKTRKGRSNPLLNLLNAYNRFVHLRRPNSLGKSRENISEHYDLSNAFFKLWLDPSMTYSSAYFDPPTLSLEEAQTKKYDNLCRKLQLAATDHVLEIGSGWGGFSMHAAKTYGCKVTTITISEEQYAEASKRIQEAGLQDRITILFSDYRVVEGQFDKIASIEMLEAVGDKYVDEYFATCSRLLKPHGLIGLQAILCPDQQYEILRDGVDFIQKHIFPGSLLMSLGRVAQALQNTGDFNLLVYEDMALHYAKTLKIWCDNFETVLDEVRGQGFDETFIRKWRYYLRYCEAAFGMRHITVAQMVYTRPNNLSLNSDVYDMGV